MTVFHVGRDENGTEHVIMLSKSPPARFTPSRRPTMCDRYLNFVENAGPLTYRDVTGTFVDTDRYPERMTIGERLYGSDMCMACRHAMRNKIGIAAAVKARERR